VGRHQKKSFPRPHAVTAKVSRKAARETRAQGMCGRSLNRATRVDNENVTKGAMPMTNRRIFVTKQESAHRAARRAIRETRLGSKNASGARQEDFSNNSNSLSR
jgi:hypothetical protein